MLVTFATGLVFPSVQRSRKIAHLIGGSGLPAARTEGAARDGDLEAGLSLFASRTLPIRFRAICARVAGLGNPSGPCSNDCSLPVVVIRSREQPEEPSSQRLPARFEQQMIPK
jgi:hypothetical protein